MPPRRRPGVPLSVRYAEGLLVAVDKAAKEIATERPGMSISRADALRVLLTEALAARGIHVRGEN